MGKTFAIWQAKIFSDLQGRVERVTPEDLANLNSFGDVVPSGSKVVGVVPDHLKAILAVAMSLGEDGLDYINLFDMAIKYEFPELAGQLIIGYGSGFEVFYVPDGDVPIDISLPNATDASALPAESGPGSRILDSHMFKD